MNAPERGPNFVGPARQERNAAPGVSHFGTISKVK
jgi:hypothetical protein